MNNINNGKATTNKTKNSQVDYIVKTLDINLFFDGTANCWRNTQARFEKIVFKCKVIGYFALFILA